MKNHIVNSLLIVVSILLTLLVAEGFTRIYIWAFQIPKNHYEFRRNRPYPYANSPFFSAEFVDEMQIDLFRVFYTPDNSRLILLKEREEFYISHKEGLRATIGTPVDFKNDILLFGGSTMYNLEVPDPFTIASYLQRLINFGQDGRYRVQNHGVTTVVQSQQIEKLKGVDLKPGDIVVFYDGINDLLQGAYYQNPEGSIWGQANSVYKNLGHVQKLIAWLGARFKGRSTLIEYVFMPFNYREVPPHITDSERLEKLLKRTSRNYLNGIVQANAMVEAKRARFYHFLQPNLFSKRRMSSYEERLSRNRRLTAAGFESVFRRGQKFLSETVKRTQDLQIASTDLSDAFDVLPDFEEIFLDPIHVNHVGNRVVARYIYKKVFGADDSVFNLEDWPWKEFHEEDRKVWEAFVHKQKTTIENVARRKKARKWYEKGVAVWKEKHPDWPEKAMQYFDKALAIDSGYSEAYYFRAHAHLNLKSYEPAIRDLDHTLKFQPKNAMAYYYRGYAHLNVQRYEQAITDFDQTIVLKPKFGEAYFYRGLTQISQNRLDQGLRDYRRACGLKIQAACHALSKKNKGVER